MCQDSCSIGGETKAQLTKSSKQVGAGLQAPVWATWPHLPPP